MSMSQNDENILLGEEDEDNSNHVGNDGTIDLGIDDLKVGLRFPSDEIATKFIENWSYKSLCALTKIWY